MAEYPLMKYWEAPDGTTYEICDDTLRKLYESGLIGKPGEDGVGIAAITLKTAAETGNTYTVLLTDGNSYDFTAPAGPEGPRGERGETGGQGPLPIAAALMRRIPRSHGDCSDSAVLFW